MAVTITGDLATTLTAFGVLAGVVGNLFMQLRTLKISNSNSSKIDANALTTRAAVTTAQAAVAAAAVTNDKVEAVHKATNSLTDRLVALTKREAYAAGGQDERDRAAGVTPQDRPPLDVQPASEAEQIKEGVKP